MKTSGYAAVHPIQPLRQVARARSGFGRARRTIWRACKLFSALTGLALPAAQSASRPPGLRAGICFPPIRPRRGATRLAAQVRQREAVAELSRLALAAAATADLLDEAVALVARTEDADCCGVLELLPDRATLLLRAGVGWEAGLVGRATVPVRPDWQLGYTLASPQPVVVANLAREMRFSGSPLLRRHAAASGISVAIRRANAPFGVLVMHATRPRAFSSADARFLQEVASVLEAALAAREQLITRQAEAERLAELERLRAEFVRSISHELRTPLAGARVSVGMVETSAGERLLPDERRLLGNARQSIELLGMFIDDLLAYNQLQAGALSLERQPLDLRGVISDAISIVGPLIAGKGQRIDLDLPVALPCLGDRRRLEQLVVNLLANAHAHTPEQTRIAVAGCIEAEWVRIAVADDGPGIPAAEHQAVFRQFYRARPGDGGSGLGLAIAKGIVELHDGRIWVESVPGQGATFQVMLPRQQGGLEQ